MAPSLLAVIIQHNIAIIEKWYINRVRPERYDYAFHQIHLNTFDHVSLKHSIIKNRNLYISL